MKNISTILIAASLTLSGQALAGDLKPGRWEVTQTIISEPPPGMDKESTDTRCLSPKEAEDMERTTRQVALRNGCKITELERDGHTLEWKQLCESSQRQLRIEGTLMIESDEHYTGKISSQSDKSQGQPLVIEERARWAGPCDS
ncbi:DUF3617 family protein [Alcanivorax sp. ZXX171]|nr:DUF3617 family protein [Alcanivorax sp. ZXX171]